ncbi:MAG TPA: DUF2062 domain-containing protein [Desulfobacteraceae bacterium]|nr:DUF2062 domain-containing protein [Desulfobacteraceae bacterium]|tara:strand:+ start:348 stop:887 length:540 start_codon:yes stop_codon:yes gene_type:complete
MTLTQKAKTLYARFLKIRGTPREIALGFALGIFLGFSPTMGVQMIIAAFVASLFKWSKIAAMIGVQLTNPVTAPVIYGLTYMVGVKVLGVANAFQLPEQPSLDTLIELIQKAPGIFGAMTLGGIIVGLPLAFISFFPVYWLFKRYQEPIASKLKSRTQTIRQKIKQRPRKKTKKKKPRR